MVAMSPSRIGCALVVGCAAIMLAGCGNEGSVEEAAPGSAVVPVSQTLTETARRTARTHFNWQMNCQGCHHPNGEGNAKRDIPPLAALEKFQRLPEGRAFLIRVPGMARSKLSDAELTDVANWMMEEFVTPGVEPRWAPYTVSEVTELRRQPIVDGVREYREKLMLRLEAASALNTGTKREGDYEI